MSHKPFSMCDNLTQVHLSLYMSKCQIVPTSCLRSYVIVVFPGHNHLLLSLSVSAVIGMPCMLTSECTDLLVNTVCSSFQCACIRGSTGNSCSGKLNP